ncbi:G0/G1 switch protein 2 [Centroberyx affinis]|uniref:G0/G1 switch protein 2 n=1 Tax=Centroberyx affinis TaxID=166261 RepID=UPI003A5BED34
METIGEIVPFAKEMLAQRPSRGMVKIYMLGTTLALFGVVGGLLETVCLPFVEQEAVEDREVELIVEEKKEKKQMSESQITLISPDAVEELETIEIRAKAKHLVAAGQRSKANRLHAS